MHASKSVDFVILRDFRIVRSTSGALLVTTCLFGMSRKSCIINTFTSCDLPNFASLQEILSISCKTIMLLSSFMHKRTRSLLCNDTSCVTKFKRLLADDSFEGLMQMRVAIINALLSHMGIPAAQIFLGCSQPGIWTSFWHVCQRAFYTRTLWPKFKGPLPLGIPADHHLVHLGKVLQEIWRSRINASDVDWLKLQQYMTFSEENKVLRHGGKAPKAVRNRPSGIW